MVDDDHTPDRRTVLRNIAAGSAAAVGVGLASGAAGADAGPEPRSSATREAFSEFGDRETVADLFERHGRPVAAELADRGYLPDDGNPVESVVSLHEYGEADADGLATVGTGTRDGTDVVDVRVQRTTDDARIEFHINPGLGDSYAMVFPEDGEEGTAVFADGTTASFSTTAGCCECYGSGCGDFRCTTDQCDSECTSSRYPNYIYYYKERKCCTEFYDGENTFCSCYWETYSCTCEEEISNNICP